MVLLFKKDFYLGISSMRGSKAQLLDLYNKLENLSNGSYCF